MDKYEIVKRIENYAPLELAEKWDCPGWVVETETRNLQKIMLALTVTDDVVNQANQLNCDMIISHHPLFFVPLKYRNIDIYCAHTNMDRCEGGTTDKLIDNLNLQKTGYIGDFTRLVSLREAISVEDFVKRLRVISPHLRYVNNFNVPKIKNIAFCAGSGSEFIQEAFENGADAFVTGDLKFHTALDSPIVVFDIGHFESEILILDVFEKLLSEMQVFRAKEKSPFIY